jgi:hypothetical protein
MASDKSKPVFDDLLQAPTATPVWETPEFKAAVAAAVAAQMVATAQTPAAAPPAPSGEMAQFMSHMNEMFSGLANSIAELTYQGSDKSQRPVDPRILASRKKGKDELDRLLEEIRREVHRVRESSHKNAAARADAIRAVAPRWILISEQVLEQRPGEPRLIKPFMVDPISQKPVPVEIFWMDEPNRGMAPANEVAKKVWKAFQQSRGEATATERESFKPSWVTDKGLVIAGHNAPASRKHIDAPPPAMDFLQDEENVTMENRPFDPFAPFVNVVGTSHAPAVSHELGKPF